MKIKLPSLQGLVKEGAQGAVTGVLDGAANLIAKFKADPTKLMEADKDLQELRVNAELKLKELDNQLEDIYTKQMDIVNQTMREEAKSEHWMQWAWRPTIGFTFCAILINNYILMPYLAKYGVQAIVVPDNVWTSILVILGAASAGRGWMKAEKAKR